MDSFVYQEVEKKEKTLREVFKEALKVTMCYTTQHKIN